MKKKSCAIVFGITGNYTFALANVLVGMKKKCKVFWNDIIVYHDGITKDEKENLNRILKCEFIDFNEKTLQVDKNSEMVKKYSLLAISRFECFDLLKKYEKVIWHDVDILIQKDFSSLLKYGEKSGFSATMTDANFLVESNFTKLIDGYNMFRPLYNSGILVLSDKLDGYEHMAKWCYDKFNELSSSLKYPDQGVLNLLIQQDKITVEEIDILEYCCHPSRKEVADSTIVHAYGNDKFWNSKRLALEFPEWDLNNEEWIRISKKETKKHDKRKQPKVSVVLSVFNRYKFLQEAVDSILNQTFEDFELVIVIEHSDVKNDIEKLLKDLNDDRIVIIKNETKLGFAKSLNVGIDIAKGEYIARMDDDDISLPKRLEKQVAYMDNNPDIGVCGAFIEFFMASEGICTLPQDDENLRIHCLSATPLFHPTVIMRKKMLDDNNLRYDPNYFTEDYELWSRIVKYTKIHNIPEVLLKYRASGENATITNAQKVHNSHISVMKKQFVEYLGFEPTDNELQLFNGRLNIMQYIHNSDEAHKLLNAFYDKIILANKKNNFYSESTLKSRLKNEYNDVKKSKLKTMVKNVLKHTPAKAVYKALMTRVYWYVESRIQETNQITDEKIRKIRKEIKEIEKTIGDCKE